MINLKKKETSIKISKNLKVSNKLAKIKQRKLLISLHQQMNSSNNYSKINQNKRNHKSN